jgi:hypothetical protein
MKCKGALLILILAGCNNAGDDSDVVGLTETGTRLADSGEVQQKGVTVGNGGDVILCTTGDGVVKSIEMLDAFEAREIRKIKVDMGDQSIPFREKVKVVLDKVKALDPYFAKYFSEATLKFINSHVEYPAPVQDIDDEGQIYFVPEGCKLTQIAIQKQPSFPGDVEYYIDKRLYDLLDEDNKALLALHEGLYHVARTMSGYTDSHRVRFFIAQLFGAAMENEESFAQLKEDLALFTVDKHGLGVGKSAKYYDSGEMKSTEVIAGKSRGRFYGNELDLTPGTRVEFYKSGELLSASFCFKRVSKSQIEDPKTANCRETDDAYPIYLDPVYKKAAPVTVNGIGRTYFYDDGFISHYTDLMKSLLTVQPSANNPTWEETISPAGFVDPLGRDLSFGMRPFDGLRFYPRGVPNEINPHWTFRSLMNRCAMPLGAAGLVGRMVMHPNGFIKSATYSGRNYCEKADGTNVVVNGGYLEFDENGYITNF